MDGSADMDDLLDQMESDLIRQTRTNQPAPLLPPTSIAMQPRGVHQNPTPKNVVTVSKYVIGEEMNKHMEGHVNIDSSLLPNTFQSKPICHDVKDLNETKKENVVPPSTNGNLDKEYPPVAEKQASQKTESITVVKRTTVEIQPNTQHVVIEKETKEVSQHELNPQLEEELSELEEDTLVPETQVISTLNVTARGSVQVVSDVSQQNLELDTEMESMLEYLNGVEEDFQQEEQFESGITENRVPERKSGGRDSVDESSDDLKLSQFADKVSEEVMSAVLDPKIDTDPNPDTSEFISQPESAAKKEGSPSVVEQNEESETKTESRQDDAEKEEHLTSENVESEQVESSDVFATEEKGQESEDPSVDKENIDSSEGDLKPIDSKSPEEPEVQKVVDIQLETAAEENDTKESEAKSSEEVLPEDNEEVPPANNVVEVAVFDDEATEEAGSVVESVSNESQDSSTEGTEEETENRPRFDSSIATIHVLHESDSDEAATPRRERRLTESELQLGKTSPYWIPDSECPHCMLCNTKFTIITRRHHCRACGRVLCGSCCSEKAILEYLQEEGKKPQPVRVCQPCSTMLARIESHEQEEQRRRESVTSEGTLNEEEATNSSTAHSASLPRGVLKTRSMTQGNEEDGPSTSSQIPSASANLTESARRSVMFRDGVRPGAPANEENPEEERSTALKPKKKSRKRTSVVRRIAELKMEDELACALPKEDSTKLLIAKPDSEQPKFEDASAVLESLCNFSVVTIVLKKNLNCTVQIFNNPNFGLVWAVSSQGFAQIGLDELFFSWTLNDQEKQKVDSEEPELDEKTALSLIPISVLRRISTIYTNSTEHEYAGVRRVDNRLMRVHTVIDPEYPLTRHVMFFRPTVQAGLENMRIPTNPFVIACFLHDNELSWATALPNRLLYKLGEKYNVFPTPFVNSVGRPPLYSTDVSGTVLKVFTDFRSWSYRMRHIPGCTVSLTNDKTIIRIPKSSIKELKEILTFSRSMVAWSCDFHQEDDSVLVCEETDPGLYSTQVFAKYIGQRESTSASFMILDGGSKVSSLQVNVVEDGVAIRLQSERLETILNAINEGHDVVESSKDMEFRVEFVEDGDWVVPENEYFPKSQIDGLCLINKFQYGLSLERALTQVLQVQGVTDYGVRMSHVFNLGDGRLQPEEEPKIYGMVEVSAKECVAMLAPHIQFLIRAGIETVSIRLFVSPFEFEYDVSRWLGLEAENDKYKQSLDQLIPMLYNMIEYVPSGFEVEFVLSIVSTKALPI